MVELEIILNWNPPLMRDRDLVKMVKTAFTAAVQYWHARQLPIHFDFRQNRYRFKPRSKKYQREKARRFKPLPVIKGGTILLVRSGLLERSLEASHPISAYPTRATIKMPAPSYVRPRDPRRPKLAEEATMTTTDDERKIIEVFEQTLQKQIDQYRARKTSRH